MGVTKTVSIISNAAGFLRRRPDLFIPLHPAPLSDAKDMGSKATAVWAGLTPQQKMAVSIAVVAVFLLLACCCWIYTCLRDRRRQRAWLATPEVRLCVVALTPQSTR